MGGEGGLGVLVVSNEDNIDGIVKLKDFMTPIKYKKNKFSKFK